MPSKTISTTAAELLPENRLRKSFIVQNEDATNNGYLKQEEPGNTTVSTTDHDHRIGPGANISVNELTDGKKAIQGRWTIIADAGTPRVSYFETEDIKR